MASFTFRLVGVVGAGVLSAGVLSVLGCSASSGQPPNAPDAAGIHWSRPRASALASGEAEEASEIGPSAEAPRPLLGILADEVAREAPDATLAFAPGEDPLDRAARLRTPQRIQAPARTRIDRTVSIDYGALAVATAVRPKGLSEGEAFSLVRIDRTPARCPVGKVPRQKITWFMPRFWSVPAVVRIGGAVLPRMDVLDGQYEDASLELLAERAAHAHWIGLTTKDETTEVVEFQGSYRPDTKRATAALKTTAHPTTLVPGVLYAYRKCNTHCAEPLGAPLREEELVVVGPPAVWFGSSDDPESQQVAFAQPFSVVSARLRPGSSATVSLVALKQDIETFRRHEPHKAPPIGSTAHEWTSFTVDVVWRAPEPSEEPGSRSSSVGQARSDAPSDDSLGPLPEVNLFTGRGIGNARVAFGNALAIDRPEPYGGCLDDGLHGDPFGTILY